MNPIMPATADGKTVTRGLRPVLVASRCELPEMGAPFVG